MNYCDNDQDDDDGGVGGGGGDDYDVSVGCQGDGIISIMMPITKDD